MSEAGSQSKPEHEFHIQIDREHFTVTIPEMTGAQLRTVPNPPISADRDLFEVRPGETDLPVSDTTTVTMHDGLRFFTAPSHINPGA